MQLSLVDITGTLNFVHKFKVLSGSMDSGQAVRTNNVMIEHIFNSKQSFNMVNKIIKMKMIHLINDLKIMVAAINQWHRVKMKMVNVLNQKGKRIE